MGASGGRPTLLLPTETLEDLTMHEIDFMMQLNNHASWKRLLALQSKERCRSRELWNVSLLA